MYLQNHRGWQGPLGIPQPNPLPKQGHPEQAAQDCIQAGLEYLQRRRLHSPSGQPGPGLRHPQREEVLPRLQLELPLLQFVPVAPCPDFPANSVLLVVEGPCLALVAVCSQSLQCKLLLPSLIDLHHCSPQDLCLMILLVSALVSKCQGCSRAFFVSGIFPLEKGSWVLTSSGQLRALTHAVALKR